MTDFFFTKKQMFLLNQHHSPALSKQSKQFNFSESESLPLSQCFAQPFDLIMSSVQNDSTQQMRGSFHSTQHVRKHKIKDIYQIEVLDNPDLLLAQTGLFKVNQHRYDGLTARTSIPKVPKTITLVNMMQQDGLIHEYIKYLI